MTRASTFTVGFTIALAAWACSLAACGGTAAPPAATRETSPSTSSSSSASTPAASAKSAGAAQAPREVTLDESAQRAAGLVVEPVRETRRPFVIQATGQLTTSEDATWRIGATVDGRVADVLVSAGDHVKRGQALARVHSHEVHEARAEYRIAKSDLERQRVLADQAGRVRDRAHRLFDLKAASREQVEAADTDFANATLAIANAQTALDKARVHITEFLDIPLDDEEHESGNHDADYVPLKAPNAGTVMERLATTGAVVAPGQHVFTVSDLSRLWMIAAVNEADLSRLRVGQSARVSVKAYPDDVFTGRVIKLGETLDAATRTLQVRIDVPNPDRRLKPEMFAAVAIESGTFASRANANEPAAPAIVVPPAAIQDLRGEPVVFVRTAPTRFEARRVTLAPAGNGAAGGSGLGDREVTAGLRPGDQVVIKGAFILKTELLKATLESD